MARTRANDYDKKRQGILSRSATLFAEHGFTGTSITMIADACGVSKALMYHYYRSKDAVLFDLLEDHLQHLVAVVEAAGSRPASPGKSCLRFQRRCWKPIAAPMPSIRCRFQA